jgi:ABC-type dipeptide/oligopeptide/nickel transport system ATPase component
MSGDDVLELQGLTRRYGDLVALDDVWFTVAEYQSFGFVGSNGAGKTTAMRTVLGVLARNAGEVRWRGRLMADEISKRIGHKLGDHGQTFSVQFAAHRIAAAGRGDGRWRDVPTPAEWLPSWAGCVSTVRGFVDPAARMDGATSVPARTGVRPERRPASQIALRARRQQRCDL